MEFQIGQKVRLKKKHELANIELRGIHYKVVQTMPFFVVVTHNNRTHTIRKDFLEIVGIIIELERLEAAFYEYYDSKIDGTDERSLEVQQLVEELMKVVKSVSINE
jgi:hypothetical protein